MIHNSAMFGEEGRKGEGKGREGGKSGPHTITENRWGGARERRLQTGGFCSEGRLSRGLMCGGLLSGEGAFVRLPVA